jgi:hypothetical protein
VVTQKSTNINKGGPAEMLKLVNVNHFGDAIFVGAVDRPETVRESVNRQSKAVGRHARCNQPSSIICVMGPDNVISWIIPSLDFTLQQSPDLSSWTDVTNEPALNLTNLQNQVVLPSADGNSF